AAALAQGSLGDLAKGDNLVAGGAALVVIEKGADAQGRGRERISRHGPVGGAGGRERVGPAKGGPSSPKGVDSRHGNRGLALKGRKRLKDSRGRGAEGAGAVGLARENAESHRDRLADIGPVLRGQGRVARPVKGS